VILNYFFFAKEDIFRQTESQNFIMSDNPWL